MVIIFQKIKKKYLIVEIRNFDNKCFICVIFVVMVSVCKVYLVEFWRIKVLYLIYMIGEIFIYFF